MLLSKTCILNGTHTHIILPTQRWLLDGKTSCFNGHIAHKSWIWLPRFRRYKAMLFKESLLRALRSRTSWLITSSWLGDGLEGSNGEVPHSWMVYFRENPNLKWMITRGAPILGNLHMRVASGKHTKNYGRSPCFMAKSTNKMAMFNSKLQMCTRR